jgi:hypothetical protein
MGQLSKQFGITEERLDELIIGLAEIETDIELGMIGEREAAI